jgi:hypothetical protein
MGDERYMFDGLGWDEEIVSLDDPHIPFNPLPECERNEKSAAERYCPKYVMTLFSQSTQAWKWRVEQDERQRSADKLRKEDVVAREVDAVEEREEVEDEDNTVDKQEEVTEAVDSSQPLSFCESMRGLSPHPLPLGERMKDRTISYVDLLRPNLVSTPKSNGEHAASASRSWGRRRRS